MGGSTEVSVCWLRRDLRLEDNAALHAALSSGRPVQIVFIFDEDILSELKNKQDRRVDFIAQALQGLQRELAEHNAAIAIYHDTPLMAWKQITADFKVKKVFFAHDYEPQAIARDKKVTAFLKSVNIDIQSVKDQCIFEKSEVVKDNGSPYTVFGAYKRKWLKTLKAADYKSYDTQKLLASGLCQHPINSSEKPNDQLANKWLKKIGFKKTDLVFTKTVVPASLLKKYGENRDFPVREATSKLGLHLRFGTTSIRKCVQVALKYNDVWLSELIWRDFFMQILFHFPHVVNGAFRPEYDAIKWRNNDDEFKAWREGCTGYPIVDAGMRELNSTGYMHNRVRMITASFLVKDLLIDWRKGEKYFAEKLLDFDLSANNGNWQWVAGTGCDAAPYFRIFNPDQQQKKFDPGFEYIKKWLPDFDSAEYPEPIVDHSMARIRTVLAYKKALKK